MVREIKATVKVEPGKLEFPAVPLFQYRRTLQEEVDEGRLTRRLCLELLEQMLMARRFEEMIAEIGAGVYEPLPNFQYSGPTHTSVGQEATAVGAVNALKLEDYITSTHRGHSDAIAKGYAAVKLMDDAALRKFLEEDKDMLGRIGCALTGKETRDELEEKALRLHVYRTICELFGRADGYCRGVGGSMHIADFRKGHLGANAIVGGHMGIATGAGISCRYRESGQVVLCFAGDGAYSNGISHESINLATMAQFKNGLMDKRFGVPVIFAIVNNQYAMSGQEAGEVTGVDFLARRAAAYDTDAMHAEVVDGMDVLAVYDATMRATALAREGKGPVLIEFMTYRFKGHSLHDPLTYRDRDELQEWQARDPIDTFCKKLTEAKFPDDQGGPVDQKTLDDLREKVRQRNDEMAKIAGHSEMPAPESVLDHMYADSASEQVPAEYARPKLKKDPPQYERDENGAILYRYAVREALLEEMMRDGRVLLFGEDVAEYGGAFGATGDLLEVFGRDRLFNTSISESAIVGAAVGMAMTGLRPVAEIMYDDFILQAMDQLGNQAAKWCYMSGGQVGVPMVLRTTIGGGRGYAGQHSQSLESITAHIPGLVIAAPADAYDAKGLLKSAIRDDNPVVFFEHQLLYNVAGPVPEEEYLVPLGKAAVKREGGDVSIVAWAYMVGEALKAAEQLEHEGISAEVIDLRTLVPLDMDLLVESVRKTGRVVVTSQAVSQGSYTGDVASQIQERAFDYLDAPVLRLGALNGVIPTAKTLEREFLPDADKLVARVKQLF